MVGIMLPGTVVVAVFVVAHAERLNILVSCWWAACLQQAKCA